MPRGYVIMTEVIHDPAGMAAHGAVTYDSLVEHGAKMLVVDADYEVREGTWEEGSRLAIMEFESPEVARHWYESEAGQEAHKLRAAAADCNVLIASGFVPKNPGNKLAVYPSSEADGLARLPDPPKWQSGGQRREQTCPAKRWASLPVEVEWWAGGSWSSVGAKPTFSSRISPLAMAELSRCSSPARGPMSSWWIGTRHLPTTRLS